MSYFSQMGALTVQQFVTPAVGIAVAIALIRGFSRRNSPTIGNFWVDMTRGMLYILLPDRLRRRHHLRRPGCACRRWPGTVIVHDALNGVTQTIARGPDRLHGGHQAARHQRRWVPQRQLGHPLREPDRPHQLAVDLPPPVHPVRAHLHLRQDGRQRPPGRGPPRRDGDHLRRAGSASPLRRAPGATRPSPPPAVPPSRPATWRARRSASATPRRRCSASRPRRPRPAPPTPPTTRSRRSAASACSPG